MSESLQPNLFTRHWPVPVALCILLCAGNLQSEIVRAVAAAGCISLMMYQWLIYLRTSSGARLLFLSLVVADIGLVSLWLLLNVVRFYTYDPESERIWEWHERVIQIQDFLLWGIAAVAVVVSVCAMFLFAHWVTKRASAVS